MEATIRELVKGYLEKAERKLEVAEKLLKSDDYYNREQMGQEYVGWMIGTVMVMMPVDIMLEEVTQSQKFAKLGKKTQSAPTSQTGFPKCKMKFSNAFWHIP